MSVYRSRLDQLSQRRACRRASRRDFLRRGAALAAGAAALSLAGPLASRQALAANLELPSWTSAGAVSDVFVVRRVPASRRSLAGGSAPAGAGASILGDAGVTRLVRMLEASGVPFYRTTARPEGVVGRENVVVVKINYQWGGGGSDSGAGRLGVNTDLLKGLIWSILQHPEGFAGEIVVAENTQDGATGPTLNDTATPANAEDQNQTLADVIAAFQGLGHPVSLRGWTALDNGGRVSGGNIGASPATGEYSTGNMDDAYILLNDPGAGAPVDGYSYPKFQTAGGHYVSMRHGVWNGAGYDADALTFINLPTLKKHCMAGCTAAWKNLIGFITCEDLSRRFGDWDTMHGYFWGYLGQGTTDYGLLGRQMALIRNPDLHILDAIWVATENNYSSNEALRADVILGGRDPFALDWYASEYILRPLAQEPWGTSAARSGTFRAATLANQKAAKSVWSGSYPWMDLDESHDADAVAESERQQMNVRVARALELPPGNNLLLQD